MDCDEAVEWQRLTSIGDQIGLDELLRRANRRLFDESPNVYCERCNAVFAGTHQHGERYADGTERTVYVARSLSSEGTKQ
jgi:hypothetical protein